MANAETLLFPQAIAGGWRKLWEVYQSLLRDYVAGHKKIISGGGSIKEGGITVHYVDFKLGYKLTRTKTV